MWSTKTWQHLIWISTINSKAFSLCNDSRLSRGLNSSIWSFGQFFRYFHKENQLWITLNLMFIYYQYNHNLFISYEYTLKELKVKASFGMFFVVRIWLSCYFGSILYPARYFLLCNLILPDLRRLFSLCLYPISCISRNIRGRK